MKIPKDLSPEEAREFAECEEEHRLAGVEHQREEEFRERLAAAELERRLGAEVIYAYTRAQAFADGNLHDVTPFAAAIGIRYPTAVTACVWDACVGAKGESDLELPGVMRLLGEFVAAYKANPTKSQRMTFPATPQEDGAGPVMVIVDCGSDDDGDPCLTLILPDDD
jgi:hypothetical protein